MRRSNKEKTTGSKGFEPSMVQGLARCGGRGGAGAASPSSSDCNRCERRGGAGVFTWLVGDCKKIATWNVRSLYVSGKLANVLSEMKRMGLDIVIKEYRKGRECVIVMGDFNGKVGENREEDTIGPFGVGVRNGNGERVVNFCKRHNLFATNTWFQQRKLAQHTWISPDKVTKNQIDFVLVDKSFRNGIQNSISMPGADCDSDHNPVIVKMKIRLQRVKKAKKTVKWNVNNLNKSEVRNAYRMRLDQQLQEEKIDGCMKVDEIWKKLKDGISTVAEEICGKEMQPKKQNWMNSEILHKMEERRKCKNMRDEEQYKKLKQEIRKLCRQAKDKYYEDKCKEIEMLDKAHSQLMYQKIKELRPKGNRGLQTIKSKQGNVLIEKDEVMERWADYVEELYKDENRGEDDIIDMSQRENEEYAISSEEIEAVI